MDIARVGLSAVGASLARARILALCTSAMLVVTASCGDVAKSVDVPPPAPITPAASIRITPSSDLVLTVGGSNIRLQAEIVGTVPKDQNPILWSSQSPAVATIDAGGLLFGKSPGTAVIVASSRTAPQVTSSVTVVVVTALLRGACYTASFPPTACATAVEAGAPPIRLSATIDGTVPPSPGVQAVVWRSLSPSIASVDQFGQVYGHFPGVATIVASARTAPEIALLFPVTVRPHVDHRQQVHVPLGDSLVDTIVATYGARAIVVDLVAAEAVDMAVTGRAIHIASMIDWFLDPPDVMGDGQGRPGLYLARRPPGTGSFHFGVRGLPPLCGSRGGCTSYDGPYVFRIRRAGPVISLPSTSNSRYFNIREGEIRTDSVWVKNIGTGEMVANVTVDVPGVQVLMPSLGVAPTAPTTENDLFRFPEGATAITFRIDGRQFRRGTVVLARITVTAPGSWSALNPGRDFEVVTVPINVTNP